MYKSVYHKNVAISGEEVHKRRTI